jgi:retron-type reverse transcriptase
VRAAYYALKRDAAAGIDGETWRHYGEAVEDHLRALAARIQRGAFRASPVRRAYIRKADGRQRPLGVPTVEDKIVQRAVVEGLNAIYEQDLFGFSYGVRPKRSPHQALDALTVGIETRRVNGVLDADIRGFVDTVNHEWLVHLALGRLWRATLRRRSQHGFVSWARMRRLLARWVPRPRIGHPYPNQRLALVTQGRSRMR